MTKLKFAALLSLCIGLATSLSANDVTRTIAMRTDFVESRLNWGNGQRGFIARWFTKVENGVIEICGAVQYQDGIAYTQSKNVLRRAYIEYEGKKIMRDMRFFRKVKRRPREDWSQVNCASTNIKAPRSAYTVYLGWDAGRAKF